MVLVQHRGCRDAVGCYVSHKSSSFYLSDDLGIHLLKAFGYPTVCRNSGVSLANKILSGLWLIMHYLRFNLLLKITKIITLLCSILGEIMIWTTSLANCVLKHE